MSRFNLPMHITRRRLLTQLGCAAVAGQGGLTAWSTAPARSATGAGAAGRHAAVPLQEAGTEAQLVDYAPDPRRRWRGLSSVGMERVYGGAQPAATAATARPLPRPDASLEDLGGMLRARFPEPHRHFIFEYYPWYGASPFRHWQQWDRVPPSDVASMLMPRLGAYDSRDLAVIEQHALWIREAGVGAINLSWWGRNSYEDLAVNQIMDVMAAHDIRVTFHIEPYANDRSRNYLDDVRYLLDRYGERRGWDTFLLLPDDRGRVGPVFKSFRTILPETVTDCHGIVRAVPDFTPDDEWARQTDSVRKSLGGEFDTVTLLADSLNMNRSAAGSFDGIAVYDNFVAAGTYAEHATRATEKGLVFSFNCNPGFDSIARRVVSPDSCYVPPTFFPPTDPLDVFDAADRERARRVAQRQIRQSLATTLAVQLDPLLRNAARGFFLVYVNSFNEWHEGHAFEPAERWNDLTPEERAVGYRNPRRGPYRLKTLRRLLAKIL